MQRDQHSQHKRRQATLLFNLGSLRQQLLKKIKNPKYNIPKIQFWGLSLSLLPWH